MLEPKLPTPLVLLESKSQVLLRIINFHFRICEEVNLAKTDPIKTEATLYRVFPNWNRCFSSKFIFSPFFKLSIGYKVALKLHNQSSLMFSKLLVDDASFATCQHWLRQHKHACLQQVLYETDPPLVRFSTAGDSLGAWCWTQQLLSLLASTLVGAGETTFDSTLAFQALELRQPLKTFQFWSDRCAWRCYRMSISFQTSYTGLGNCMRARYFRRRVLPGSTGPPHHNLPLRQLE